jgi:hypothetical protein
MCDLLSEGPGCYCSFMFRRSPSPRASAISAAATQPARSSAPSSGLSTAYRPRSATIKALDELLRFQGLAPIVKRHRHR